jgi:hypothetical protein
MNKMGHRPTSPHIRQALSAGFPNSWTGRSQSITWPPRSSNITPLTCRVVGLHVNNTVHTAKIYDMLRGRTYAFNWRCSRKSFVVLGTKPNMAWTSAGIQKVLTSRLIKAARKLKEVHISKNYFISHDKLIAFAVYGIIFQWICML